MTRNDLNWNNEWVGDMRMAFGVWWIQLLEEVEDEKDNNPTDDEKVEDDYDVPLPDPVKKNT